MARMYGQGKGISKSSMPYKKVPPRWLSIDSKEVTNLIETLAKKGFKPSMSSITYSLMNIFLAFNSSDKVPYIVKEIFSVSPEQSWKDSKPL